MVRNKLKSLRYVEWAAGIIVLSVVSLLVIASNTHKTPNIHNSVGINEQVNYQGRLLTNTGAVVPDGTYNMEFKIYQDGNGVLGGGDETLKWTETRTSGNKVTVKNGYFSVYLGAVTSFGSSIDWNQDTLWLSINIGGTGSPSWDGEMSPFSRFSSSPYALNSKALNGLSSGNFVQMAQGTQTDGSSTNASISINKTAGTANLLELLRGGANVVTVSNSGATTFQNQTNSTNAFQIQSSGGDQLINVDTLTTENLITNGQFEANTTGWAAKGAAGSPSQSTSQHYLGNGSMQFTTTAAANDGVKYNYALASQTNYTMTFYVKTSTLISAVSTINIGRTEDGSTDSDCATSQTISGAGWTRLTCTFTTGNVSGTNSIYLKQSDAAARTIYIDSAQLQTSTNLVSNPDLEVDDSGWNLYSSPTTAQTTAESYTSSGSLQVDTTGIAATEGVTVAPTVQPNTTYSASFWVKTDAATVGSKTFNLYKRFDSTDTTSTSCGSASLSPGVWTNISCTFTTGNITANSPYIGPVVNDNGTPLTYYVDTANVSIAKYNSNDIGRISLNAAIDSPLTVRGAQDSTSALQVQQQNGKTILKVDTLNGFVGIGTDSATKTLQVDGKALVRATSSDTDTFQVANSATIGATNSVIFNVAANSRAVSVGLGSNTLNTNLNVYGTQLVNTKVNNANAFRITDASGIGALSFSTTSGNRKLSIGGTGTGNDGKLAVSNSNGDTVFDLDSTGTGSVQFNSDYFDILTTTGNQLYLDSSIFFVGGVSGTTSYNDSTGVFEISDGAGTTGLYYDIISSRLGLGANYNTPGYTLDVGGDINVGSGSVYRVAGTAGSTATCSGGQFLQDATVVGGIVTGGSCAAAGGVTTVGTFSGSSIANGASISGSTITFGPADATNPGMVTTGTQTFAGAKTFNNNTTVKAISNGLNTFRVQDTSGTDVLMVSTGTANKKVYVGGSVDGMFGVYGTTGNGLEISTAGNGSFIAGLNSYDFYDAGYSNSLFSVDGSTGRFGIGIGLGGASYTLDVLGDINSSSGYRVGGTAGAAATCSGGQFLQNQVVVGGITTGGTCAAGGAGGVTTVGTFSGSSIANGASIAGNTITFGPADGTNPGMVTTGAQTFAGLKTFGAGLTVSGGTATINTSANDTSIGNASSILTLTGSSSSAIVLNGISISAAELNLLDGHNVALVDTDDAVATAIIGTGALNTGSITSGFGAIDVGTDGITTTGTIGTAGSTTFTGNTGTFSGAIAANGGITFNNSTDTLGAFTNAGTQDANTNLIVNIGNAGTDFTSGGGLMLAGDLAASGNTTLGDAATDGLTFTGEILGASPLTFEGATNNNIYTIFSITDPTSSNKTITFADATGTVLLHSMISSDATITSAGALTIAANAIGASEVTDGTLTTSDLSASAGILNTQLANSGITVTAGSGLVTGGAVSLGGTVTLDIGAGNGITVNANDITIDLTAATDGLSATTSSSSGLEVLSSGVTLLQGCADAQVLQWNEASDVWQCATAGGSGVTTVGTFSGTSIANGASISGSTITFGPADATNPGMVTTGSQTFAGLKTFGAGLTVSGGTATINTSANNTSIGNGSGTLTLTGSSASTFVINAVTIDATEFNRLNGTTAALVDQDDFISGDGAGATSSGSGLEAGTGGIGLLQGCSNGQTLKWNEASSIWECGSDRATSQNRLSGNYTNTTTGFTDVDDNATGNSDMAFAVGANETWIFEAVLYGNSPAAADIKFQVTCPASTTGVIGFENSEDTVTVSNIACGASSGTLNTDAANNVHRINGTIVTGANSGTVMVQAGQVVASGTTTILAGSYITAYKVSGADLAEIYYSKNGSIQPGTVVVADPSIAAGVKSSSNAYAKGIVGVVSTQPGMVLGNSDATGAPVPLALSGRVPVKVSTENGSIKPGDQLTSSSTPGVAMKATKAGAIIGQALTAYDGQGVGEVTVFIKTSYGLGGSVSDLANGSSSTDPSFAQNVLAGLMTNQIQPDAVNLSEVVTDRLVAGLEVITPRVTSDEVALNSIKPIGSTIQINGDVNINGTLTADTIKANRIEGLDLFVEKAVIAGSTSAQSTSQGGSSEDDEVPAAESNIANLTVQSADISSNLSVGGGLTVGGPAEFKGNTIFYKLVTFVEKTIFKNDVTFEGRVAFNNDTGGFAVIKTGQDRVRVVFEQPYQQVPVVTLNVKNGVFVQYAYTELTGTGFTVVLKEPATQDVEFAWTAISVNNARTAQAN